MMKTIFFSIFTLVSQVTGNRRIIPGIQPTLGSEACNSLNLNFQQPYNQLNSQFVKPSGVTSLNTNSLTLEESYTELPINKRIEEETQQRTGNVLLNSMDDAPNSRRSSSADPQGDIAEYIKVNTKSGQSICDFKGVVEEVLRDCSQNVLKKGGNENNVIDSLKSAETLNSFSKQQTFESKYSSNDDFRKLENENTNRSGNSQKDQDKDIKDKDSNINNDFYSYDDIFNEDIPLLNRRLNSEQIKKELLDPTRGVILRQTTEPKVVLLRSSRVCFACSSVNDPSCWKPSRSTTVKYCRKGHNACISKTMRINSKGPLVLIRDCSDTCDENNLPGLTLKYESCSICHSDLCNSACSINTHTLLLFTFIALLIKFMSEYIWRY